MALSSSDRSARLWKAERALASLFNACMPQHDTEASLDA